MVQFQLQGVIGDSAKNQSLREAKDMGKDLNNELYRGSMCLRESDYGSGVDPIASIGYRQEYR